MLAESCTGRGFSLNISFSSLVQEARREHVSERERRQHEADARCVVEQNPSQLLPAELEHRTRQYATQRRKRIDSFLKHVRTRNKAFLEQACPKP